jgi:hypothetical protein
MSTRDERRYVCDDCGEAGRPKAILPAMDVLAYYCHDEEKSCYNYVLMREALPLG